MSESTPRPQETGLRRSLSLPLITFYGLGTILGAGIYVLIGEVAGEAGLRAPLAFLIAAVVAGFTAFSYAELSSRIPLSAGEAAYAWKAFGRRLPAALAGYGVVLTGIVSAATILNGFVGYLEEFFPVWRAPTITLTLVLLTGLAAWGVAESVAAAALVTLLELAGLVFVIALSIGRVDPASVPWRELAPTLEPHAWSGVIAGAYLAFFAFIGFEDIANMAEEVRDPRRNLPRAIIISLASATALYMLVAFLAVLVLPPAELAASNAPLADMIGGSGPGSRTAITLISLVAVINGALIQIIMASRVVYGMAGEQRVAPRLFRRVHPARRTPVRATLAVGAVVLVLAVLFPLATLARITSTITLLVFSLVNVSLLRLRRHDHGGDEAPVAYPIWVPATGLALSLALVGLQAALLF